MDIFDRQEKKLARIAYCICQYTESDRDLLDNLSYLTNSTDINLFVECRSGMDDWDDYLNSHRCQLHSLHEDTQNWYTLYKQLPVMANWPLPLGSINHLLSIQYLVQCSTQNPNASPYDLYVFSHARIRLTDNLDLVPAIGTGSLHFCNHMSTYCPNPMWIVVPRDQIHVFDNIVSKLYFWLTNQSDLHFPWGLVQGLPSKFNWGLVIAQYMESLGIVCHHNWFPIQIVQHPLF